MSRCRRLFGLLLLATLSLACLVGSGQRANDQPTAQVTVWPRANRPNLIVILTDDLDERLGTLQYMPVLQSQLVGQGLSLQGFLVADAVCCPSRASFLRGQYVHNHQVYTNVPPAGSFARFHELGLEASTIGTWLQAAGYRTGYFGKYLNEYPDRAQRTYVPPGWQAWSVPSKGKPYVGLRYSLNQDGTEVEYGSDPANYLTDILASRAVDFILRSAGEPEPIFVFLATYAPHEPAQPAARHAEALPGLRAPRPPSFNEADVSDKPAGLRFDPLLTPNEQSKLDELHRARVQTMLAVDDLLAALLQALQDSGRLENSYIIFTSDNGYHLGQHRLKGGKASPYEEDIRVPFIVRGPGVPAGEVISQHLVGNIDLAPTLAELAGLLPPDFVDGRSLVPLLHRQALPSPWRQAFLVEHYAMKAAEESLSPKELLVEYSDFPGQAGKPAPNQTEPAQAYAALVTARYKYVEYRDGFRELYALEQDPYELENRAAQADPALLRQLSAWLQALRTCAGETCRQAEQAAP